MTKSIKYYLYHIIGKKIGVTRDLTKRVTEKQGYAPDEYEVLLTSEDIDYISTMEIELQKSYGYKVDQKLYKNLTKSNKVMNINVTEQTSTFPVPLNKLKGRLLDNLGLVWETSHGDFRITKNNIDWIMANAETSMYDRRRCFIYNRAFPRGCTIVNNELLEPRFQDEPLTVKQLAFNARHDVKLGDNVYDLIRTWANDKGIYDQGDSKTQYLKLMEEAGELAEALLKNDRPEIIDAIGDMVVVLTNLAALENLRIEDCVTSAYGVIKNRKGKMENGTFVKDNKQTL